MYSIEFTEFAEKQFLKLNSNLQNRILAVLERIRIRPYSFVKRKEGTPYFIMRIGDYRAILDIRNEKLIIYVIEVGHRKKIYKR
jgi:mRNA interferase RelE/StbE